MNTHSCLHNHLSKDNLLFSWCLLPFFFLSFPLLVFADNFIFSLHTYTHTINIILVFCFYYLSSSPPNSKKSFTHDLSLSLSPFLLLPTFLLPSPLLHFEYSTFLLLSISDFLWLITIFLYIF